MLKYYLKKIKKHTVFLFNAKKIGDKVINVAVFGNDISKDLLKYKEKFLDSMNEKKKSLMHIREEIYSNEKNFLHRDVLEIEIDYQIEIINFLIYTYDIEANKIDPNYKIIDDINNINYDHYNRTFWGLDKSYLNQKFELSKKTNYSIYFSKEEVIYLLECSKIIIPSIRYDFGDYPNLAFNGGLLKIHDSKKFHIKDVISLIFHEMTHFFRYKNGIKNLGFFYSFSDYPTLEEGIAIYNEFIYGNRLIDYGGKDPIYDICFQYLLEDVTEEEKIKKISKLLGTKGFGAKKSNDYYHRFYRFAKIGSKNLYLKDLIYTKGYYNVVELIEEDPDNYDRIMAGRVGVNTLRKGIIKPDNNLDFRNFFDTMEGKFRELYEKKLKEIEYKKYNQKR